jgi:uncharacterized protein
MPTKNEVYIYNKTQEVFVATDVVVANTYLRRLVGLLGKTRKWCKPGRALWIIPSCGVHTIGMLFPIDLIYLDQTRRVVYLEEYVRPFRIPKVSFKASSVLELPPHTIFRTGTKLGDVLDIPYLARTAVARNEKEQELPAESVARCAVSIHN